MIQLPDESESSPNYHFQCIMKPQLNSINSHINKYFCFIFLHLSTDTKLVDPAINSALAQGGLEDQSVKVSVSY